MDISFTSSDSTLAVSVKDDGTPYDVGFTVGYGIQSVYQKLGLLFPGKYRIELGKDSEKAFRICLNQ